MTTLRLTLCLIGVSAALAPSALAQDPPLTPYGDYTTPTTVTEPVPTSTVAPDPATGEEPTKAARGVKPSRQSGTNPASVAAAVPTPTRGSAPSQLAFTGFDAWLVILAGAGLMAAAGGVVLRGRNRGTR